jgi:hypothetical protein
LHGAIRLRSAFFTECCHDICSHRAPPRRNKPTGPPRSRPRAVLINVLKNFPLRCFPRWTTVDFHKINPESVENCEVVHIWKKFIYSARRFRRPRNPPFWQARRRGRLDFMRRTGCPERVGLTRSTEVWPDDRSR